MVIKFQIGKALVKSEALLNAIAGAAAASEQGRAVKRSSHRMQRAPLHVVVISQGVPPAAAAAGCVVFVRGGPVVGSCFDHLLLKCCSFIRSVTVYPLLQRWQRQRQ